MNYKGHQNNLELGKEYSKLIIFSKDEEQTFIQKEYSYENGKTVKIIDGINWIISEYEHHDENFNVSFFKFDENPKDKTLNSIKEIKTSDGLEIEELLFEIKGDKKELVYKGKKDYSNQKLILETYAYPEMNYIIKHEWDKNGSIESIIYPNNGGIYENKFDSEGFLVECLNFKYEGMCEKTSYEYKNGKLLKMLEYPHMEFKKTLFKKGISFKGQPDFINETTYQYNPEGLIEQTVKKEIQSGDIIDVTYYQYEK